MVRIRQEMVGIHQETLRKHYRDELDAGAPRAIAAVAHSLFKKAISDTHPQAAACAMFFLKTRARWRETNREREPIAGSHLSVSIDTIDPVEASRIYQRVISGNADYDE